jgi:hypothetical protein
MRFWRRWRIIRFSALAFAATAIGASAAQAMPAVEQDGGNVKVTPKAAPVSSGGYDWTYVEVGAGVAGGIVLIGGAVLVGTRRRDIEPAKA